MNDALANLTPGTVAMLRTSDRRHPWQIEIVSIGECSINFTTAKTAGAIVLRTDGSVSHVMRYAQRRGAFPTTSMLLGIELCA